MVYIPNSEAKRKQRLAKETYKKEEEERKKENTQKFIQWQQDNPGKGLWDYIMQGN